jgi:diguanylate cyclase (GGDEF)-like protein
VLVTADAQPNIARNARVDAAIASVIEKPLDIDELARTLDQAFEFHEKRVNTLRGQRRSEPHTTSLLLVEDNPADSDLIIEMLSGHCVRTVTRLSEALRLIHDERFETIITDVALPDARGIDAVVRLHASAPEAAIIAISSLDDDALAQQIIQLGAQDYLLKQSLVRRTLLRSITYGRERKRAQQRLMQLAHYDQLTGLANRTSFLDHMTRIAAHARRMQHRVAVMLLDLDGFKAVNDSLGHDAGDALLQEVSHRIRQVFREYDVVARLGGDEFAVLLTDVDGAGQVAGASERLLFAIAQPIWLQQECVTISASIGIALFPDAAESIGDLLRGADSAMYEAKRAGRNAYRFLQPGETPPRFSGMPAPVSAVHELLRVTPRPVPRESSPEVSKPVEPAAGQAQAAGTGRGLR